MVIALPDFISADEVTRQEAARQAGPPFQDLTSGCIQPESDNKQPGLSSTMVPEMSTGMEVNLKDTCVRYEGQGESHRVEKKQLHWLYLRLEGTD